MTSLLPDTGRLVDAAVAEAQAAGRAPSLVLGVVRDGRLVHTRRRRRARRSGRPGARRRHQYRIGSITKTMTAALVLQLRDEGRLALDDLLYRHLPGTPVGERHAAPAPRPRRRPAARARRRLVGAHRRRRPRRAARRADPGQGRVPAAPHLPLLQPGVRPARRGRSSGSPATRGRRCSAARLLRPAGHARARRTTRWSRSPAATSCTPGTERCGRSRAPTPARWRRPGSSGRRSPTWPGGRRSWPSRSRRCSPPRRSPRCARRSSSATWSRGPAGTGSAWSSTGWASGSTSATAARCPATSPPSRCTGRREPAWWRSRTRTATASAGWARPRC